APQASHSDRPLGHDTSLFIGPARNGGLLDHELAFGYGDDKSRVVELRASTSTDDRRRDLEQLAADPHNVCPCAQWDPVEIDSRVVLRRRAHVGRCAHVIHRRTHHACSPQVPVCCPDLAIARNTTERTWPSPESSSLTCTRWPSPSKPAVR